MLTIHKRTWLKVLDLISHEANHKAKRIKTIELLEQHRERLPNWSETLNGLVLFVGDYRRTIKSCISGYSIHLSAQSVSLMKLLVRKISMVNTQERVFCCCNVINPWPHGIKGSVGEFVVCIGERWEFAVVC